jgi:uncharacterized protein with von Willebrand factor type A (vWA) domain
MTSPLSLSSHSNAREAYAALESISARYHKAHQKREKVTLMIAASSAPRKASKLAPLTATLARETFDVYEVRVHFDPKAPNEVREAQWMAANSSA